ncbi:MAG: AMP phosphorylase [Thermofilaceae archaeon]
MSLPLRVRLLGFASGTPLLVLDDTAAYSLGVRPHDRVLVRRGGSEIVAVVNVAQNLSPDIALVNDEVARALALKTGELVEVLAVQPPRSSQYIKAFLSGSSLSYEEVRTIIEDIVKNSLDEVELTALVTAANQRGLSVEEAYYFSRAMVETGERLNLGVNPILDKHSIGGVPGDKTTLLIVPIIASLGYYIPKTSSRAITSPAGTADRAEVLMPVNLTLEEVHSIVFNVRGCIAWGGALGLAPADDKIIKVEYPLAIDPFLVPSIIAKKAAVGATHIVVDLPVGRGAKVKTIEEARNLSRILVEVSKRMGIKVACVATLGDQPVGRAAGPALEAREALFALLGKGPVDLVDKAVSLAGMLLEMVGISDGKAIALEALKSGKAYLKMKEIIEAQGGNPDLKPQDIPVGDKRLTLYAEREGMVIWVNNTAIATAARLAGAPKDKGAGIELHAKIGSLVKNGYPLLTVYSEHSTKLQAAEEYLETVMAIGVGKPEENMVLAHLHYESMVSLEH